MITVIIGHRGTGKTELMKRLTLYYQGQQVSFIDLDAEIERRSDRKIQEIFNESGEARFRQLEAQYFSELLKKISGKAFIVAGAGFDISQIPPSVHVIWVRRRTDSEGRIFLNRPRLNHDISPLEEFLQRAQRREKHYSERADFVYLMPEGEVEDHLQAQEQERRILMSDLKDVKGVLTVKASVFKTEPRWQQFKNRYGKKGLDFFELRDDLLSAEQIKRILNELPEDKFLYSFRNASTAESTLANPDLTSLLSKVSFVDWAWELGPPTTILNRVPKEKLILSLHEASQFQDWIHYESRVAHMKYAPEVDQFDDLGRAHQWQKEKSQTRSFLPRSSTSRWDWYRISRRGHQLLNFWKEDEGMAGDQPSLWQWLMAPQCVNGFAAVLGDPVHHSFTPLEHSDFFYQRSLPVLAVNIGRQEWDKAIPVLRQMGLCYAAVTSPHKENAARLCRHPKLKAVNTLYWYPSQKRWLGTSTDEQGFLELIQNLPADQTATDRIVVWGGGGTLEGIQKTLPEVRYFSSRTGQPRQSDKAADEPSPTSLIWAAPRLPDTLMPPKKWRPKFVFDLNYKEDSMGREYAQQCGAQYYSGLVMFKSQAREQRLFWQKCEETP